jgi:hypothetical protein
MNRGDLFLSRCALPERGVQREWPSTITNGQKLVLMFRLPQIIFSDVDFGQKWQLARKQPSLAKTVAGTKNGTVSRERRPEYNHCLHQESVCACGPYKSLLRKDLTRSYGADPAVRRPHECAQSSVAELRML